MRKIFKYAFVNQEICNGCQNCTRVCPVLAVKVEKINDKRRASVDKQMCQACTICVMRCPKQAIEIKQRTSVLEIGVEVQAHLADRIQEICSAAHMYPEQVICYCHRIQAKEVVAAILEGAKTPEEIGQKTGVRTGCGVLCITTVIRLLRAAGFDLEKAPGHQWYGVRASIWDIPAEVMEKYPEYYLREDKEAMDKMFTGGEQKK